MINLEKPRYDHVFLDQLFQNILEDDISSPGARYPGGNYFQYPEDLSVSGYRICWQLLNDGVNIKNFRFLVLNILLKGGTESVKQRQNFKYVRARFKHLRFACANFDRRHRYPWSLNLVTSLMGHMQDAFKNRQIARTRIFGTILFLTILPAFYALVRFQMRSFLPDSNKNMIAYHQRENAKIDSIVRKEKITAQDFHDLRKIISRRVAFNDTFRVLHSSHYLDKISLYLADINGEMGDYHDRLVEKNISTPGSYKENIFILEKKLINKIIHLIR
ncbi:hypothetical protein AD936_21545 [Gluconobacter japonicus]|uniref:Uncharacterized protein n=1 Tax=Gluconobacter cerinus TaxID=38307 RepID=A0A1B6VH55_9PROT|nr:hypothetical protein [Gluconobacter cerinus]KXV23741.1 hypothetical protein AD936_21545 [Gluconobacter japonicus]OAJ66307.1 hypothetical protein A0123_02984 [Gluconobacter cerinus]